MEYQINISINVNVDASGVVKGITVGAPDVVSLAPSAGINFSYSWKVCDIRYGIITFGAKHQISNLLPKDTEIKVKWKDKEFAAKSHKTVKGRIDGLTALINGNPDCFKVQHSNVMNWNPATYTLEII